MGSENIVKIFKKDKYLESFEGNEYTFDLERIPDESLEGDIEIFGCPFSLGRNYILKIAIQQSGNISFKGWRTCESYENNSYFHTNQTPEMITATEQQADTIDGLFSGRIKFEGIKISVGATIQKISRIDLEKEQELVGHTIYIS